MRAGSRESRGGLVQDDCILNRLWRTRRYYERHGASSRRLAVGEWRKRRRLFRSLRLMTRTRAATDKLLGQPIEDWFAAFVLELFRS